METLYSSLNKLFLFLHHLWMNVIIHVDTRMVEIFRYTIMGFFVTAALIQLVVYWVLFKKVWNYKKTAETKTLPPVSVIICAKNEDDNLTKFLPAILGQDYPEFEVLVVNDCSYDHTADILEEFAKKHSKLRIVTIKEDEHYRHGKKFALMCGIKGAKYEHIVLTDADCYPGGNQWLSSMAGNYSNDLTEIVLGYGAYEKKKGFLNKFIRYDTFYIAIQYISMALAGKTYMGVGRNLSYRKSLFFKHKGFASHYFLESGDDDLFINEAAGVKNVSVEISRQGITFSKPKSSFREWYNQKRRHISTFKYYNSKTISRLTWITGSQYAFWIFFILSLFVQIYPVFVLSLFALRLISQMLIFKKAMDKLGEKDLLLFSPVFELFLLFIYPALSLSNFILKENKWKS